MARSVDHVCILVKDIEQAMEHFKTIIGVTAPEMLEQEPVKQESFGGGDRFISVFFRGRGDACDIQLMQPVNPESPLYKRLERHGEGIHHICFGTTHIADTFQRLKDEGVSLRGDRFIVDENNPASKWTWIMPGYAHGVLIEVMTK